jgi:hypothetical protein
MSLGWYPPFRLPFPIRQATLSHIEFLMPQRKHVDFEAYFLLIYFLKRLRIRLITLHLHLKHIKITMTCQQQQREELLCCNFDCDCNYEHKQLPSSSRPSCGTTSRSIGHITEEQEKERESPLPSFKVKVKLKEKPRRSVSFQYSSTLFCYYIPEHEPQDWYTAEDEEIFKAEAQKEVDVLRRMKSASGQSDSYTQHHQNMCIVGLEQQLISPEFSAKRERRKKLVKDAVLREQSKIDTGHGNSSNKVKQIAEAARRYSERSVINAKAFGDFQYIQSRE